MRSYDEYCAIAKSLDVVGDRWTLLIVRELALRGASRYTDLRNGLPGIATNLLAERLRELEHAGVVEREQAPPPIATTLLRLTPRGEQLRPVLEDLVRWGIPLMTEQRPDDAVRSHWLAWALELMLTDLEPDAPAATIELRTGDQPIVLEARDGAIRVRLGSADDADATLEGPPKPILGLLLGLLELTDANDRGVVYRGDPTVLDRIGVGEGAAFLAERAGEVAGPLAERAGEVAGPLAERAGEVAGPLAERAGEVGRVHPDHEQRDER